MPTYDYECDACGHTFDAFQNMSDAPLKKCPSCNKLKLRRLIGGGLGVIFKGSGFYVTDSKKSSSGGAKSSSSSGSKESSGSSESSSTETSSKSGSSGGDSATSSGSAKKETSSANKTG